jgi:hypothetical protein
MTEEPTEERDAKRIEADADVVEVFRDVTDELTEQEYGNRRPAGTTALILYLAVADGVDDEAVAFHLERQGYDDLADLWDSVETIDRIVEESDI